MRDRQILITGGTGGLGRSVTTAVLNRGGFPTVTYRNEREVEALLKGVAAEHRSRLRLVAVDVTDEAAVAAVIDEMPRLDAAIHLVGGFAMGPTAEFSFADWQREIMLNLNTAFLVCKHSLRKMLPQNEGRIVTIGSRGAEQPSGQLAAYCAAKAGVVALTKAIADETRGTGVTANVVLPSVIDTPANRAAMGDAAATGWVSPESLAEVICFLASTAARDIRGAAVPVYGNT